MNRLERDFRLVWIALLPWRFGCILVTVAHHQEGNLFRDRHRRVVILADGPLPQKLHVVIAQLYENFVHGAVPSVLCAVRVPDALNLCSRVEASQLLKHAPILKFEERDRFNVGMLG